MAFASYPDKFQLLEAIGVISKKDGEKSAACGGNYQDEVTLRVDDDSEACGDNGNCEENVLEAISKVCFPTSLLVSLTLGVLSISFAK